MDEKLLIAIIGFAGGLLATFMAPWANWGIEKMRMRQHSRKETIASWRQMLNRVVKEEEYSDTGHLSFLLQQEPDYLRLKAFLSPDVEDMLAQGEVEPEYALEAVQSEISRIEREWKLL